MLLHLRLVLHLALIFIIGAVGITFSGDTVSSFGANNNFMVLLTESH